jgi:DNA recombination protein RmuC
MISEIISSIIILVLLVLLIRKNQHAETSNDFKKWQLGLQEMLSKHQQENTAAQNDLKQDMQKSLFEQRSQMEARQLDSLKLLQNSVQEAMKDTRTQLIQFLDQNTKNLNHQMDKLTEQTTIHLKEISGQVDKRLTEGFEKTTATFTDIVKRLALIDQAQKKITELSSNVVSLQNILADKRSRGAFGEVQLNGLVRNVMPENSFSLQHSLSNQKRCDCILFLPEPTGNLVIDAKFPLENYRHLMESETDSEKKSFEQKFKQDIKAHVQAISSKYIIENETADGAMMFIPAEAVFAEIHAHHPDLVEFANRAKVWLVSPTTMMAILTTARAVLKDADTRKQVHIIQEHLVHLSKDFERFQKRMDSLAKHMDMAQENVSQIHTSAKKISSRFAKIERLDLSEEAKLSIAETTTED